LGRERETSMYGDDELSLLSEEIYSVEDAEKAIQDREFLVRNVKDC